jgi:hypothetical protein
MAAPVAAVDILQTLLQELETLEEMIQWQIRLVKEIQVVMEEAGMEF